MMTLGEILKMDRGFVMPLEKPAGSSLDLFVGDVRIAAAEVLVVEESVAVRVTELSLNE
jgi:flagellar motor switch protein FliN/FliY